MSSEKNPDDFAWLKTMVAREDEIGPIVPGGAQGGLARQTPAKATSRARVVSAALRARARVRGSFYAYASTERDAV